MPVEITAAIQDLVRRAWWWILVNGLRFAMVWESRVSK
jgi:hypothetical protein